MIKTSSPLQLDNHSHYNRISSSLLSLPSQPRMKPATLAACGDSFIDHVDRQFLSPLSTSALLALSSKLHECYVGAASASHAQMLPSHITTLPSGHERGQYLAVDLGGTNMRVALVRLQDNEATVQKLDKSTIPEAVKTGTAREFFDWIAERIVNLVGQSTLDEGEHEWKLGVTWSFPFSQTAVNRGTIHQMGKGFNIPSIINASLTDLLHDALESLHPPHPIRITALLNDAVATLLSHAFTRPMTRMGLICGTGTNATCLCPTQYLSEEKYHHDSADVERAWEEFVLVNTEWSMVGRGVLPVTKYDRIVDQESGMPGFQPFEMMVSGRYIGEIVRLVCLDGVKNGAWSFDCVPEGWNTKWSVHTAVCSTVEANGNYTGRTIQLLSSHFPLSYDRYTTEDAILFRQICTAVSTRSAHLVAASTIALLNVNHELCKSPPPKPRTWSSDSSSPGTPSPSDSGLGSMDEEIRWSRRGSIFSAQGSRRGSLASPILLSVQPKTTIDVDIPLREDADIIFGEHGIVMDEPADMSDDDDDIVVVAFCGSVMEKYFTFRERCQNILDELVKHPCVDTTKKVNGDIKVNGDVNVNGDGAKFSGIDTGLRPDQRRIILEENTDGGILGAGILAAVMDSKSKGFSDSFC